MRSYCRAVMSIVCVVSCSSQVTAEWLKVDISTIGQSKGWAPGFTQWVPPAINCGSSQTTTVDGSTFTTAMTAPAGDYSDANGDLDGYTNLEDYLACLAQGGSTFPGSKCVTDMASDTNK